MTQAEKFEYDRLRKRVKYPNSEDKEWLKDPNRMVPLVYDISRNV
jgi:hypothetical protein